MKSGKIITDDRVLRSSKTAFCWIINSIYQNDSLAAIWNNIKKLHWICLMRCDDSNTFDYFLLLLYHFVCDLPSQEFHLRENDTHIRNELKYFNVLISHFGSIVFHQKQFIMDLGNLFKFSMKNAKIICAIVLNFRSFHGNPF